MTHCKGCGAPLPPPLKYGREKLWCSERCRKRQYDHQCIDCGTRVSGTTPRRTQGRCAPCAMRRRREETRARHIESIQRWAREHGEPPAITDWCAHHALVLHDEPRAKRARQALREGFPSAQAVIGVFGSWNAAIEAAGFAPRAAHSGDGNVARRRPRRARAAA